MSDLQPTDTISRQAAIDALDEEPYVWDDTPEELKVWNMWHRHKDALMSLPSAQPEIVRCKDCEHWKRQTNYQGVPLSFGFCKSDDMWRSIYGEKYVISHIDTDDDFYCGYAERRTNG